MKTIVPIFEALEQVNSPQKVKPNTTYRWSNFCIRLPYNEGTLLYNSLTGALYLLEKGESPELLQSEMVRTWCFVPDDFDERKYSRQLQTLIGMLQKPKKKKNFTIVTTTDCNARCFYCFELGCERNHMSQEVARDVAAYMTRVSGEEELEITWFGGEPLYNREAIEVICSELHRMGKPFHSIMITNGYYLDLETAITARDKWGLRDVQITIDGTKETYERTKAYINSDDAAYERVMSNIDSALDAGLRVLIRLNIDGKNADDLFMLANELGERFAGCDNLHAYVFPLKEYLGRIPAFSSEDEAEERCLALQKRLDTLWPGYAANLPRKMVTNSCMADNDSAEVIMPDGGIEKCEHIQHQDQIGTIYSEQRDTAKIRAWKERIFLPACERCELYPQCILLSKCDTAHLGCSKADQSLKKRRLEKQIINAYQQYVKQEEYSETE